MWNKISKIYVWTNLVRPTWRLPSAYQEVEYIESTATSSNNWQLLYTWVNISSNYLQLQFKMNPTSLRYEGNYFYNSNWVWNSFERTELDGWGYFNTGNTVKLFKPIPMSTGVDYEFDVKYNNGVMTVNGSSQSYSGSIAWNTGFIFFAWRGNSDWSNLQSCSAEKLYYLKIYTGSSFTLVRDYVPCYRKSDSVAWMYDLVNDVFYPSASSVPFVAWPEV